MKNRLSIHAILAILALSLLISPLAGAVSSSSIELETIDTVAGYSALVRLSNAPGNCDAEVKLEKPDGGEVAFPVSVDEDGMAKMDIEGYYTKKAGEYQVMGRCTNRNENYSAAETFRVYADEVSSSVSEVDMDKKTAAADGNTPVNIAVYLKDRYGNPIAKHNVNLIAGRLGDEVILISNNYTDNQGKIIFNVYSQESGVASFIVYDETDNTTLNDRPEIAFYESQSQFAAMGGYSDNVLFASSSTSGPVSYLEIEELSETVSVGELLNFKVIAYDDQKNAAMDYTGEVRFSSSDNNATLPKDYEFQAEDQGSHTFSLSLSFKTSGTQTLTVTDLDDNEIYGEIEIEVGNKSTGNSSTSGSGSSSSDNNDLQILTPLPGTYSADTLTFTGNAPYGTTVKILDNEEEIGSTEATVSDDFEFKAENLNDGPHVFLLTTVDSKDEVLETSDEIVITIDTTAPQIDKTTIDPEGDISTNEAFVVTVYTEPNLPQVGIIFNNSIIPLTEDVLIDGVYSGTLTAPEELGEYDLDVLVVDELGNEISYEKLATVNVVQGSTVAPEEEAVVANPGTVTGVEAVAGDQKVTLSWQTPIDGTEGAVIDHYRIYYGPDPELLFSTIDTKDSSTTTTIENLQNGSTYYFALVALDLQDVESAMKSSIVSGTPESAEDVLFSAAVEDQQTKEEEAKAEEDALDTTVKEEDTPDTGPEVIWLMGLSLGFAHFYFQLRKRPVAKRETGFEAFSSPQSIKRIIPIIDIRR